MRTDVPEVITLAARGSISDPAGHPALHPRPAGEAYGALNRGEITGRAIVVMA